LPEIIDISVPLVPEMPVWPGNTGVRIVPLRRMATGDKNNLSGLDCGLHTGTHVDAPWHFGPVVEGKPAKRIDEVPLEWCYGDGVLLDFAHKRPYDPITVIDPMKELDRIGDSLKPRDIVLFYTGHYDRHYGKPEWLINYSGFTEEAAAYLLEEKRIKNWGADTPSPDAPGNLAYPVHRVTRRTEIPHMENLYNLHLLAGRRFTFYGFPLKIRGGSGSPIRAVAMMD